MTEMMRNLKENLPNSEDLLHAIGLQHERSTHAALTTALTAFALGAVAGAVVATLFAPKPGAEVRQELNQRVRAWSDKVRASARQDENEQPAQH